MEEFKSEIFNLYLNKKISNEVLFENINRSIEAHNNIPIRVTGIDETAFKLKNDTTEYVGEISKLPESKRDINPNSGRVSYNFTIALVNILKQRATIIGEIIQLSDCLDFKVLRVIELKRLDK